MFRGRTYAYICTPDLKEFIVIVFLAAAVRLVQMKEKVQYCFVSENKNACQEGEAWGVIYIIKPNLSQLTYYPEFHDLVSIRWSVTGSGRLR